ncbi:uncharacterized protein ARMOST_17128 [Armillaria ostoyae]|uniref:RNA polymerase III subunit Rpc25 domain-containing protein n=1 Tax=Armillaria ostoyae TaxID=47428 RepID=A0A284RY45_ARMOS|nr:uncharacterized protein ARMOST_17128 [Armillaria ostoyae]
MQTLFGVRFNIPFSPSLTGVLVMMGFFDDLYIPSIYLPHISAFDSNERAFFCVPDLQFTMSAELLDTDVASRMYIDAGEVVRVRVEADEFHDDEPAPPKMAEGVQVKQEPRRAPYRIIWSLALETCRGGMCLKKKM